LDSPERHCVAETDQRFVNTKCLGMLIDGHAQKTGIRRRGADASVLIVMNSFEGPVEFTLPKFEGGEAWNLLVDTNIADGAPGKAFAIGNRFCCSP
jgi:isoamylase